MAENLPNPEDIARQAAEQAAALAKEKIEKAKAAFEKLKALKEKLKNKKPPKFPPTSKFEPKKLPKEGVKKFNKP
jgi:hypothetical protein